MCHVHVCIHHVNRCATAVAELKRNVKFFGQTRYVIKIHIIRYINLYKITASLSDVNALREKVKQLMELIQKLIVEFRAVKLSFPC